MMSAFVIISGCWMQLFNWSRWLQWIRNTSLD